MLPKTTKSVFVTLVILFLLTPSVVAPGGAIQSTPVKITIDAGHGGYDPGSIVSGLSEKKVNLQIALKVKELGEDHPALDFVLTRTSDNFVPLLDRLGYAEEHGNDGYLSVQANSFSDPRVNGVETILDRTRKQGGASWDMAKLIQESVVGRTDARDRGIRYQRLYTRYTEIPSAMVEVGFLTSPSERERLASSTYRESIARGIIQGLLIYFSR
ncbi:N-acetylmuramoyl-L-alanine amidase [Candidatus Bipolaricaulota bacterium]|nr:N-acetylmuramoyl-L-alanine amidase [Candidatus Bipolaricaulota bacterium]